MEIIHIHLSQNLLYCLFRKIEERQGIWGNMHRLGQAKTYLSCPTVVATWSTWTVISGLKTSWCRRGWEGCWYCCREITVHPFKGKFCNAIPTLKFDKSNLIVLKVNKIRPLLSLTLMYLPNRQFRFDSAVVKYVAFSQNRAFDAKFSSCLKIFR